MKLWGAMEGKGSRGQMRSLGRGLGEGGGQRYRALSLSFCPSTGTNHFPHASHALEAWTCGRAPRGTVPFTGWWLFCVQAYSWDTFPPAAPVARHFGHVPGALCRPGGLRRTQTVTSGWCALGIILTCYQSS